MTCTYHRQSLLVQTQTPNTAHEVHSVAVCTVKRIHTVSTVQLSSSLTLVMVGSKGSMW